MSVLQLSPISNLDTLDEERPLQHQKTATNDDLPSDVFYAEVAVPRATWTREQQQQFAADICQLMIVCNIAWWAVEQPYWHEFFQKWVPGSLMPGHKELSNRILKEEVGKVVDKMKLKVKGRFATGQCDGWKNMSKTSLIASLINVEYIVSFHLRQQVVYSPTPLAIPTQHL